MLVLCAFLMIGSPAHSRHDSDDISVTGSIGFGGYYKPRYPTPLILTVENHGELFEGWLLADLYAWVPPTSYTHPLVIPSGASREFEMACFGCWNSNPCPVPIGVLSLDGAPLSGIDLQGLTLGRCDTLLVHIGTPVNPIDNLFSGDNPGYLIMNEAGLLQSGGLINYPPRIFPVISEPDALPKNSSLYQSVGTIVTGLGTYLTVDQEIKITITNYVRQGGNLLVYYRDGIDPVDGWDNDPLLPVSPMSGTSTVSIDSFMEASHEVINWEAIEEGIPFRVIDYERGIHGEAFLSEETVDDEHENESTLSEISTVWEIPDSYQVIKVNPTGQIEGLIIDGLQVLTVRNFGGGRAGFASFDPFMGSPSAEDQPIRLLASYGLLDPLCPTTELVAEVPVDYSMLEDARVQDFFRQGVIPGSNRFMVWLVKLGPALFYLLGLPILVIVARGRGRVILVLFILWSIGFTAATLASKSKPGVDNVVINEASIYWCEALSMDETDIDPSEASMLYTCLTYNSRSSITQSVSWDYPGGIIDEWVEPTTWNYDYVTIEGGTSYVKLPDLVLEKAVFSLGFDNGRTFLYRRNAPELTAAGQLIVGPNHARLILDADLPFSCIAGQLIVRSNDLWIWKDLGGQDEAMHIDIELVDGLEVTRERSLFPDYTGELLKDENAGRTTPNDTQMGYTLNRFSELVKSMPVGRAQSYTQSRITGRPSQAIVMLMSTGIPTEITTERVESERHALTIIVITVPVVYDEEPH